MVSYFSGCVSYERANDFLKTTLDIDIATSCVQNNAEYIGCEVRKEELNLIPSDYKENCDKMYISIDGTGVPTVEGQCREAKNVVFERVKDGKSKKWYGACISNITDFKVYLENLSFMMRYLECPVIVILGDGARWIDGIKEDMFPNSVRIIDFYHACEYLNRACELRFSDENECKEQYSKLVTMLRDGDVFEVINELKHLCKKPNAKSDFDKIINYFDNHKYNMDYKDYEDIGHKIGSGSVEGACKYVIGVRFKRNGMRWTVADANSIICLRLCILNNVLKKFFHMRFNL